MEYIVDRNKIINCPPPTQHPVEAFLAGIAPAVKKLSAQEWHFAKAEIFATIQKFEFNMLNKQQQFPCTGPNETCSTGQPSPWDGKQSTFSWKGQQSSTSQSEENEAIHLTLREYFQTLP
ncbi:unnamed protein product [Psylliodes chrysocephalus]|uniref:Uncharacterized protein n=1 Tax=Psylliodes chrysocephalus TaxID=3402493 RepID=A0A9P0GL54_9CUCU|nr:unnamed protein product [Psylliodes chrysocephala]